MLRLHQRSGWVVVPAAAAALAAAAAAGCRLLLVDKDPHHYHASAFPLARGWIASQSLRHDRLFDTTAGRNTSATSSSTTTTLTRKSTPSASFHVVYCEAAAAPARSVSPEEAKATIPPPPLHARTRTTAADAYFQAHNGELPRPKVMHATLPPPPQPAVGHTDSSLHENKTAGSTTNGHRKKILIIGDVHGCYDEMMLLYQTAVQQHNDGYEFAHVILVGDLVNKGPQSLAVLRHVQQQQQQQRWWAVRGNHDQGALRTALLEPKETKQSDNKYAWMEDHLTDTDVEFLSELPYTLRIPRAWFAQTNENVKNSHANDNENPSIGNGDFLIVHAGLIPGVALKEQTIETMITLREVEVINNPGGVHRYDRPTDSSSSDSEHRVPWASVWKGPETIVFGHDARRGLQQYDWAMGLDTGACYGKKLTGLILPDRKLVQVDALDVHCPIGGDE